MLQRASFGDRQTVRGLHSGLQIQARRWTFNVYWSFANFHTISRNFGETPGAFSTARVLFDRGTSA